jgi:hypothetical protein
MVNIIKLLCIIISNPYGISSLGADLQHEHIFIMAYYFNDWIKTLFLLLLDEFQNIFLTTNLF